jgi:hypothetical protein
MFINIAVSTKVILSLRYFDITKCNHCFISNFYNKVENFDTLTSPKLNVEDRCKLSKQQIQDK